MSSTVCIHANFEDTGEVRNMQGCHKRGAKPVLQAVFHCKDCGIYFAGTARKKVPPPPPFDAIKQGVQTGRIKREELVRYGYLTPEQRAELDALDACDHKHRTPIMVTLRCEDCGRTWIERVEVVRQDATTPTEG